MFQVNELYGSAWSEREYIIALHYYVRNRGKRRDEKAPYVKELSALLGRTTASITLRMENFASLDTPLGKKGLDHINPKGREVFRSWIRRKKGLAQTAEVFIRDLDESNSEPLFNPRKAKLVFGKYEIDERIADGNFGTVYSCINVNTKKRYAIKILRTDRIDDLESLSRFRREIKTLRKIRHKNVIRILAHNLGKRKSFPGFVMDFADCSLRECLRNHASKESSQDERPVILIEKAIEIFRSMLSGVEALHKNGFIHRDINPGNILRLPTGNWVLADFNLAKFFSSPAITTYNTRTNQSWGTEFYTAPEQWSDFKGTKPQADLYSLGILLWELFSPSLPSMYHPAIFRPRSLLPVFVKATEKIPERRYESVDMLRNDFENALREPPSAETKVKSPE